MKKILIVDDQPENVKLLKERLTRENYEIISAFDGNSAIELAAEQSPDLILLDVMMPKMSGYSVCEVLSKGEKTRTIPVILVTALTNPEDLRRGFEAGAFDYIKKPVNKIELLARVNSALRFSEFNSMLLDLEKAKTYTATILRTKHDLNQPLTKINLAVSAIAREAKGKDFSRDVVQKKLDVIDDAARSIIELLEKLSSIKKPEITDYVNDLKILKIDG